MPAVMEQMYLKGFSERKKKKSLFQSGKQTFWAVTYHACLSGILRLLLKYCLDSSVI